MIQFHSLSDKREFLNRCCNSYYQTSRSTVRNQRACWAGDSRFRTFRLLSTDCRQLWEDWFGDLKLRVCVSFSIPVRCVRGSAITERNSHGAHFSAPLFAFAQSASTVQRILAVFTSPFPFSALYFHQNIVVRFWLSTVFKLNGNTEQKSAYTLVWLLFEIRGPEIAPGHLPTPLFSQF